MKIADVMMSLEGVGGLPRGGLFGTLWWVDSGKPAGHTSMRSVLGFKQALWDCCTLRHFFGEPHCVWFLVTLALYICFPYDLEAAREGFAARWVLMRLAINWAIAFSYYSLACWALFVRGLAVRKYKPGALPTFGNMLHNVWYWSLGILQWSLWECAMMRLYATGRVPYVPDDELLRSPSQMLLTILWVLALPILKDHHFFFGHRLAHIRALYKYLHAVHHRNADTEPFGGLCSHPFEHLLFYSVSLTPVLYFPCSPFLFSFFLWHIIFLAAPIHSGFEDHWNADQFHYTHHRTFECNYGAPLSAWIDIATGTFRERLGASSEYKGAYRGDYEIKEEEDKRDVQAQVYSAQGYLGWQSEDQALHTVFCLAAVGTLFASVLRAAAGQPPLVPACAVGALIAYGPVVVALLLASVYDRMPWRWPFHKERIFGAFGLCTLVGWAWCLLPVYHFVTLLCTP